MSFPKNIGVIDTMLDLPYADRNWSRHFGALLRDPESRTQAFTHPAGYMFKDPITQARGSDPIGDTLRQMDRFNIEVAVINVADDLSAQAVKAHPQRFAGQLYVDPNAGMEAIHAIRRAHEELGIVAASFFPAGVGVPIDDKRAYPVYAKCAELGIALFVNVGIPGPRVPFQPQYVGHLDEVCWYFPELKVITRHGGEPWADLLVKLMLKWPNLYYSTSAVAPKYWPKDIIDFANTRGADKIMYAGYYPSGLSLERSFQELENVALRDHVWPKFLRENAIRVLGLKSQEKADASRYGEHV